MSAANTKQRGATAHAVPANNGIYKIVAQSLKNLNPPLHISASDLGKYCEIIDFPSRKFLKLSLLTKEQLKQHVNESTAVADQDWTPVNNSEHEAETSSLDGEAVVQEIDKEMGKAVKEPKTHSTSSVGPVSSFLKSKGLDIPSEKLGRLMHVLSTAPSTFAQRGLIPADSINVPKEEELLNEVHFFRRHLKQKHEKTKNAALIEPHHSSTSPHVTNIHHHYYYMDSCSCAHEYSHEEIHPIPFRGSPIHRIHSAPHPPHHFPPYGVHSDHDFNPRGPPHHRNIRPNRQQNLQGKQGYATDH